MHLSSKDYVLHFLKFLPWDSCFASAEYGGLDLMDILKPMIKCCRWCCRTNIIVLIWVSVVLLFHKCSCLLHLRLYTVSTPHVNNDAVIVPHICYISLLRCNYYHEYLACEEEGFSERYVLAEEVWELLSAERLVILLKIAHLQLNALERQSQFRSISHLASENKSINRKDKYLHKFQTH